MIEMVRRFLRQKIRSVATIVLLALLAVLGGPVGSSSGPGASGYLALLILAAASISHDASSGALQMILARPIRRTDYLFGRYFGIVVAFAAYAVASVALGLIMSTIWGPRPPIDPLELVGSIVLVTLWAAQMAAALIFFSTFMAGYGDVIAMLLLQIFVVVRTNVAWLRKASETVGHELLPAVAWDRAFRLESDGLSAAGRAVFATTLFLAAAVVIFSRREFAYGRD